MTSDAQDCVLPDECDVRTSAAIRELLSAALDTHGAIRLDASAVTRVDTSAVQVLAAFTRDARAAGTEVTWTAVSAPFVHAATLLGASSLLGLPGDVPFVPNLSGE